MQQAVMKLGLTILSLGEGEGEREGSQVVILIFISALPSHLLKKCSSNSSGASLTYFRRLFILMFNSWTKWL